MLRAMHASKYALSFAIREVQITFHSMMQSAHLAALVSQAPISACHKDHIEMLVEWQSAEALRHVDIGAVRAQTRSMKMLLNSLQTLVAQDAGTRGDSIEIELTAKLVGQFCEIMDQKLRNLDDIACWVANSTVGAGTASTEGAAHDCE